MPSDPHETSNLAFNKKFARIAKAMKDKLLNIVMGDSRVEVGWGRRPMARRFSEAISPRVLTRRN